MSNPSDPSDDLFGDEIFRYTRQDAIRDGYLLDITPSAKQRADLKIPTAITLGLWESLTVKEEFRAEHPVVLDLCDGVAFARAGLTTSRWFDGDHGGILLFKFKTQGRTVNVKFVLGPGDDGRSVATIMLPAED